jgi:hypothetical protein
MKLSRLALIGPVLVLISLSSGCVVATHDRGYDEGYREGYYDREHHRYWHDHRWRDCEDRDDHCRD